MRENLRGRALFARRIPLARRRSRSQLALPPGSPSPSPSADAGLPAEAPAVSHHNRVPVLVILVLILAIEAIVISTNWDKWQYRTVIAKAKAAMAEGRWDDAVTYWDKHGKNYPGAIATVPYRTDRARSRMGAGNYRGAVDDYNYVIAQLTDKKKAVGSEILSDLANCQAQLGENDKALATYQRVLELDPNDTGANLFIGRTLLKKGRIVEAATRFQAIPVEKYPEDLKKDWQEIEERYIRKAEEQAAALTPTTDSLKSHSTPLPAAPQPAVTPTTAP